MQCLNLKPGSKNILITSHSYCTMDLCKNSEILFISACWVKWGGGGDCGRESRLAGLQLLVCHSFTDIMWVKFARGGKEVRGF